MKFFIAITVGLALLALIQAQDESNQPGSSEPDSSAAPPSDEPGPPRSEGPERLPRPGRPRRRPFVHRFPRPQPNEEQEIENANPEGNPAQRRPVFFDDIIDLGKQNIIRSNRKRTTTTTTTTTVSM